MMIYTVNYESWNKEESYIIDVFPTEGEAKKCKSDCIQEDGYDRAGEYFIEEHILPENIVLACYEKVIADKQK